MRDEIDAGKGKEMRSKIKALPAIAALRRRQAGGSGVKDKNKTKEHLLRERIKELNCLYGISRIVEERGSLKKIFQKIVNIIPRAWQYPDITCARIVFEDKEYKTGNFKKTKWTQKEDIIVNKKKAGLIEVGYLSKKTNADEGPFLKEERKLLDAVAERLRRIVECEQAEATIKNLSKFPNQNTNPVMRISKEGILLYVNPSGKWVTDSDGVNVGDKISEKWRKLIKDNYKSKKTTNIEISLDNKMFSWTMIPVFEEGYVNVYIVDITDRRDAENELRLHSTIMDNMYEGVYLVRMDDGIIVYTNPKFEEMFGYKSGEMISRHVSIVNDPADRNPEKTAKEIMEILNKTRAWHGEIRNIKKDGTPFWCVANVSTFNHPEHGKVLVAVHSDITERKKAEEALHRSEEKFRVLYNNSPDMYASVSSDDASILLCNETLLKKTGYSREEIIGSPIFTMYHDDCMSRVKEAFQQFVETGVIQDKELILKRKDGSKIDVSLNVNVIRDETGKILHSISSLRDITERKETEKALKESEYKYKSLFQNLNSAYAYCQVIFDKKGIPTDFKYLEVNSAFEKITGLKDVVGKRVTEVIPTIKKETPELFDIYGKVASTGKGTSFEINVSPLKTWFSIAAYCPKKDHFVAIFEDITDRKKAEETLREAKGYTDNIIKSMVDTLIVTNREGEIKTVNKATLDLLGYKEEEIIGKSIGILFAEEEEEEEEFMFNDIRNLIRNNFIKNFKTIYKTKTGIKIPVSLTGSVLRDGNGKISGAVCIARDMRETFKLIDNLEKSVAKLTSFRKASIYMLEDLDKTGKNLLQAKEELEKKAEELENFVYTVSHDLKAPLVSLGGFSSALFKEYKDKLGDEGLHYLQRIQFNVSRMEKLIKDLLKLSRSVSVIGEPEYIDVEEILDEIKKEFNVQLKNKKIKLNIALPLPKPWGDATRIKQVFSNLISNAIQFMGNQKNPKIEVGSSVSEDKFYQFYVKDNGIGIAKTHQERIFRIFERLENVETEGTGVGLAIVKRIVEYHGGRIRVESKKGKGSTFYFSLKNEEGEN